MHGEDKSARLSRGCSLVLTYLRNNRGLFSARELYDVLRLELDELAPGLTTVYRSIETLLKLELVQAVSLGQGEKSFEYVEPGRHHHHLICTSCSNSIHLDSCFVEDICSKIEKHHDFTVRAHVLELFGVCLECQRSE
jgi:Fur family transcriptional regulator, ferric uptake regulator